MIQLSKMEQWTRGIVVVFCFFSFCATASADNWLQFRGSAANAASPATSSTKWADEEGQIQNVR